MECACVYVHEEEKMRGILKESRFLTWNNSHVPCV